MIPFDAGMTIEAVKPLLAVAPLVAAAGVTAAAGALQSYFQQQAAKRAAAEAAAREQLLAGQGQEAAGIKAAGENQQNAYARMMEQLTSILQSRNRG